MLAELKKYIEDIGVSKAISEALMVLISAAITFATVFIWIAAIG